MGITIERRRSAPATELTELIIPRTNEATITPVENMLAANSIPDAFSLEIAATAAERRFLFRSADPVMGRHLARQAGTAYPQAGFRSVDADRDPAFLGFGERVAARVLCLRGPVYLPLRTFRDPDVDDEKSAQADPMLGIFSALGGLPRGWRALAQLVLQPAPHDWARPYLSLANEPRHPTDGRREALVSLALIVALGLVAIAGLYGYIWYRQQDWANLWALAAGLLVGLPFSLWLAWALLARPSYDRRLIAEKLSRPAYTAELRLAVFAPAAVPAERVEARLGQLAVAYRQFDLSSGNGLVPVPVDVDDRDLRCLDPLARARRRPTLNTRELAGLWHLPQAGADLPGYERTTERKRLPRPEVVAHGCHIGMSEHQRTRVEVRLADAVIERHCLLAAKTGRGKTSLLLRIARHVMEHAGPDGRYRCLLLVDPHSDLARAALALVPASRRDDVVYLDVANAERPFGINPLDTGLWPDRDKAVSNTLAVFRREFDRFWGPRMEDAFRFSLLTLYEANEAMCRSDPNGRDAQYTVLDVPTLLTDPDYRGEMLEGVEDRAVQGWWEGYWNTLDRRMQEEVSNPVKTKIHRYVGSRASRALLGQPRSTIDPRSWVRDGKLVLVNTARGVVGEDTSALLGGTLINLAALLAAEQARTPRAERRRMTLLVDEFHSMPGADYEFVLSELGKYGANIWLATQDLARLAMFDRDGTRSLRSSVFANIDGLFAYNVSAEDARYLAAEFAGELDEADLLKTGDQRCYIRLSHRGEREPAFSVRLLPPPDGDPHLRDELAKESAGRYGRDRRLVEADLRNALGRLELAREHASEKRGKNRRLPGAGTPAGEAQPEAAGPRKTTRSRSRNPRTGGSASDVRSNAQAELPLPRLRAVDEAGA